LQTLNTVVFVDADDTLWENTRYFNAVLERWTALMEVCGVPGARALGVLEETEERNIPTTGYGAAPFVLSVREAFATLVPEPGPGRAAAFEEFAQGAEAGIRDHPIVLLPGVAEGVRALAEASRLVMLTKGQADEQLAKAERSGLAGFFEAVRVVDEKTTDTYRDVCAEFAVVPAAAWMVGNSPRSDINPARRAGLNTILVAHDAPWHRELEPLVPDGLPTARADTFASVAGLVFGPRKT